MAVIVRFLKSGVVDWAMLRKFGVEI